MFMIDARSFFEGTFGYRLLLSASYETDSAARKPAIYTFHGLTYSEMSCSYLPRYLCKVNPFQAPTSFMAAHAETTTSRYPRTVTMAGRMERGM